MEDEAEAAAAVDSSARDQVFSTLELAEMIFMELPPRMLLVTVQGVCRQWQAIVEGSTPIQQALFFKPIHGPYLRSTPTTRHRYYLETISKKTGKVACFHPMYIRLLKYLLQHRPLPAKLAHADASWRRSLLSQPGITKFRKRREAPDDIGELAIERIHAPPGGCTLQFAMDELSGVIVGPEFLDKMSRRPASLHEKPNAWKHNSAKDFLRRITGYTRLRR